LDDNLSLVSRKRPYKLGKREATMAETRRRIVEGAASEYVENGIAATSMQMVARRADVAPGTVLNHFPDPDDLVRAVIFKWTEEVQLPGPDDIDADAPLAERLRALFTAVYGLYARTGWIYQIMHTSADHPVLVEATRGWEASSGEMMNRALGTAAGRADNLRIVATFIDPRVWDVFSSNGMPLERIAEMASIMTHHWIEQSD
jgi:AcrR family transcriptional regulator